MSASRSAVAWIAATCLLAFIEPSHAAPRTAPPPGLRENVPAVFAIKDAKIVVSPDKTIDRATLVIRDGVIAAVGENVEVPADARVFSGAGKTIYPGLIDAYSELSAEASRAAASENGGAGYWNSNITPQVSASTIYSPDGAANRKLRGQGVTARVVAPSAGIIKGTSALVSTGEGTGKQVILKDAVALHLKLTVARGSGGYPNSPMGAYTLVRQALFDAGWYGQAWDTFAQHSDLPRPERSHALAVLRNYPGRPGLVIIDAADELYFLRADRIAREFSLNAVVRGSGEEFKRLDEIKATGRTVIVPLSFPKPPNVATPEAAMNVTLDRLMDWELAPENPGRLDAAGVKIALTGYGLNDSGQLLSAVRRAVRRGLKPESALRALSITPAEIAGVSDVMGTLEAGKAANFLIANGPLFENKTKVLETWVDGQRHEIEAEPTADLRGTWTAEIIKPDGQPESFSIELTGTPAKLSGKISRGDKSTKLISPTLNERQLTSSFKGDPLGFSGVVQLSATISAPPAAAADKPQELSWLGTVVWADGKNTASSAKRTAGPKESKEEPDDAKKSEESKDEAADKSPDGDAKGKGDDKDATDKDKKPDDKKPLPTLSKVNFPLGAFGRAAPPEQPKHVLFRGATIWTSGPQGNLQNADLLVEAGKIVALGHNLTVPEGAQVIDAAGKHLSPGIIDCHSHAATDGGINESGQTITAEVRIGDFINPNDVNIYRQLAGGVTSSNILHGSANTIGGQNQVLKFRWGAGPEEMKFAGAPAGIKFALGENVKQSNRIGTTRGGDRYPQTRMGVEQLVRDAFEAAKQYRAGWDLWTRTKAGLPPRIDLELEALAEVLEGKRLIHCHSYRQDEILALMRTCESFNVKIATFQHVLEGYKVADLIAEHGAGGSSFSDWWAYKFEVFDAIPYNGALLHNAGVIVSFNSDDAELARRLNLEAAKAVKYGNLPPEEALKFVTLNPARQLRIDGKVGSLEVGKDADVVVWSASPLSTYSRCEQTWIDGRRYFDLQEDKQLRSEAASLKAQLVQRVLSSGESSAGPGDDKKDRWPTEDEFCHDHAHDGHGD